MSIGKIKHNQAMNSGIPEDFQSAEDFNEEECNLCIEPWICNTATLWFDKERAHIRNDFRTTHPRENHPHWTEQLSELTDHQLVEDSVRRHTSAEEDYQETEDTDEEWELEMDAEDEDDDDDDDDEELNLQGEAEEDEGESSAETEKGAQEGALLTVIDRRNMTNTGNMCYLTAPVQVMHNIAPYKSLIIDPATFQDKPFGKDVKPLTDALTHVLVELDIQGQKLDGAYTDQLLAALHHMDGRWQHEQDDAVELWRFILLQLVEAVKNPDLILKEAISDYMRAAGEDLMHLGTECINRMLLFRADGHDSTLMDLFYTQIVRESECGTCRAVSRTFHHEPMIILDLPEDTTSSQAFGLMELLQLNLGTTDAHGLRCPNDAEHIMSETFRRITINPAHLVVGIKRTIKESPGGINAARLNQVNMPIQLDVASFTTGVILPTERRFGTTWTSEQQHLYQLHAVVHYIPRMKHYVAYVWRNEQWVRFDDLALKPVVQAPDQGIQNVS